MQKLIVPALLILALILAGCGKAPAQAALKAADDAVAKVKPEAEKYVPDQLAKLTAAVSDAKGHFDEGKYGEALARAQEIPAKANEVAFAAKMKKDELARQWAAAQGSVPDLVKGLSDHVEALASMKKLPKSFDKTQLESARTSLAGVTAGWTAATEAYTGGDLKNALAKADDVKTRAEELKKALEAAPKPKK